MGEAQFDELRDSLMRLVERIPGNEYPAHLSLTEAQEEIESVARLAIGEIRKASDSEQVGDEPSGAEVMPPPDPIDLDTPNLGPLPRGIFPEWSENYIGAVAAEMEVPRELVAGMELGCLATTNQRKAVVEIKPGYREPLNLFVMPTMDSGNRKTAVVNKVTGTVRKWESEQVEAQKPLIKQAHSFRETDSARIAELRKQAAKTAGAELARLRGEVAELERALPDVPAPFQMITGDTTIEKLGPLLVNNDECMSIFDDEGGFLEILGGRYSGGIPNLELVLQAYSGSPHQASRLGREGVTLHSPALTIAISPQAEFLRGLAVRKPEFRTRGFFARCLFLLPPSPLGYRAGDGPSIPASVEREHDKAIRALLSAKRPADGPEVIKLSAEARAVWLAFWVHIETTMREGGSLEHMRDFAGKIPGAAARIAGNLHRGDLALHSDPFSVALPKATMMRALDCADVFIKHAIAAFDLMGTKQDVTGARRVWEWIKRSRKPRFTFHEAHLALRGSFQRSDDLETPIDVLVERYYIIPVASDHGVPRPRGRPTRPFEVNPKLSEGWES
jgi:Protein of unknown function (DUF3987)